ncbi:unnamed protein product [Rangifer tarandus platyrhynchus]|uniref:Basic proline-rich protein-like n=1 Tax=Rangifer tarandus platyrhynchus TaxID=3082113 RepID=A0ABN8YE68_RANTA|nr:unnamed protein product [Rangifer tarandus platyrhynchus]
MVLTNSPAPALPSHASAAGFGFGKDSVQSQEEPEAAAPGAHPGEPRQSHRAPKRAHPTPAAPGAPWLRQDARTQALPAAQRSAPPPPPPPPPRSGPLPAPCPLSAPTHRRQLRGKFGGTAAATARLLGVRWRRGAEGADPEAGRGGRSRAAGAARREAGRRRPGPRACRSPPPAPAPRAAAAPAPGGGVRGSPSLPPHPPRGPSGAPGAPLLRARLGGEAPRVGSERGKEAQKLGENSLRPAHT